MVKHSKVNHYRITNPKNFTKIKTKYKPLLSFLAPDIDVKREITKELFQISKKSPVQIFLERKKRKIPFEENNER